MCGLLGGPIHWSQATDSSRRQRLLQLQKVRQLLKLFRLDIQDFHGQSYLLTSPTGASQMVADLGLLWPTVERLLGRSIDPLNMPWPDSP